MSEEHGRSLSQQEQSLFNDFFAVLRGRAIPFVVLRNYEDFPARIGHDLDVFIRRQDAPAAKKIFYELLVAARATVLISHARDYYFDIRFSLDGSPANAIHVDLYHGSFTWHGLYYLSEEKLLAETRQFNGWPIPRPAHEAFNIFFASILWGGFYKVRYQPRIAELLMTSEERAEFDACALAVFGPSGLPPFDPCSRILPDKSQVKAYAANLRLAFKRKCLRKSPLRTTAQLARHWLVEFGCLVRPKGLVFAVISPDEIGPAIVTELIRRVGDLFCENQSYALNLPSGNRNFLTALFRLAKEWLKCWRRWPLRGWKKKAQTQLVLLEHHSEDWWCNPARYGFHRLPPWLVKLAARSTPQPDLTFLLNADDQHLPPRYREWAKTTSRCFIVENARTPVAVADCVEATLVAYLQKREASQ